MGLKDFLKPTFPKLLVSFSPLAGLLSLWLRIVVFFEGTTTGLLGTPPAVNEVSIVILLILFLEGIFLFAVFYIVFSTAAFFAKEIFPLKIPIESSFWSNPIAKALLAFGLDFLFFYTLIPLLPLHWG